MFLSGNLELHLCVYFKLAGIHAENELSPVPLPVLGEQQHDSRTPAWLATVDTSETVPTSQTLTLSYMQSLLASLQAYLCLVSNTSESHFQKLVLILWCIAGSSSLCSGRWLHLPPLSLPPAFIKLSRPLPEVSLPLWLEFVRHLLQTVCWGNPQEHSMPTWTVFACKCFPQCCSVSNSGWWGLCSGNWDYKQVSDTPDNNAAIITTHKHQNIHTESQCSKSRLPFYNSGPQWFNKALLKPGYI